MIVYVVEDWYEYGSFNIVGIFSTRELAEECVKKALTYYNIVEYKLDECPETD